MPRWCEQHGLARWFLLSLLCVCFVFGSTEVAADTEVAVEVDSGVVYMDEPFLIHVIISDLRGQSWSNIRIPDGDGLEVADQPTHRGEQWTNGVQSIRRSYPAVATRTGTVTVGPVTVDVGGRRFTMEAFTVNVRRAGNSDRLSVSVRTVPDRVYEGQAFSIVAEVRIRQFVDDATGITGDAWAMFRRTDRQTNWGIWEPIIRDTGQQRLIIDRAREITETGPDGEPATYYVFEIPRTIRAGAEGQQPVGPLKVVLDYPEALVIGRDFRGNPDPQITRSTRLIAQPERNYVTILPLPRDGRPDSFNGAIGRFRINTIPSTRNVSVDDPFTLIYDIIDESEIPAPMDLLAGPRFDTEAVFGDAFRIRDEELIGTVEARSDDRERRRKIFQQTIRVADENVTEIPAIPFSYFDPTIEEFVTIHSRPIPINVTPAEQVDVGDLLLEPEATDAGGPGDGPMANPEPGGLRRTLTIGTAAGPEQFGVMDLVVVLVPALAYGCFLLATRTRPEREETTVKRARSRKARRRAEQRLASIRDSDGADAAHEISQVLGAYVNERLGLDNESPTPDEVRRALSSTTPPVPAVMIDRTVDVMKRCDAWRYQPGHSDDLAALRTEARSLMEGIESAT